MFAPNDARHFRTAVRIGGLSLVLTAMAGCATYRDQADYPVSVSSGFSLPEYLAEPVVSIEQDDLERMLEVSWNQKIRVTNTRPSTTDVFSNCRDYLKGATDETRARQKDQQQTMVEVGAMCRAAQWLGEARPSDTSNIPDVFIDQTLPERFPPEIALRPPGARELDEVRYWSDINPGYESDVVALNEAEYRHGAGTQRLSLIGRGDFNGDGSEDVLVSSRDLLKGENGFNVRLFVLTVNDDREWELIQRTPRQ